MQPKPCTYVDWKQTHKLQCGRVLGCLSVDLGVLWAVFTLGFVRECGKSFGNAGAIFLDKRIAMIAKIVIIISLKVGKK